MSAPDPFPINSRPDPDSRETGPEQSPGETGTCRPARPRRVRPRPGQRLARPEAGPAPLTAEQRLLILDSWRRSGLPAGDFAPLVGVSKHTLYSWKQKFEADGPAGLADQPRRGPAGQPGARSHRTSATAQAAVAWVTSSRTRPSTACRGEQPVSTAVPGSGLTADTDCLSPTPSANRRRGRGGGRGRRTCQAGRCRSR